MWPLDGPPEGIEEGPRLAETELPEPGVLIEVDKLSELPDSFVDCREPDPPEVVVRTLLREPAEAVVVELEDFVKFDFEADRTCAVAVPPALPVEEA